MFGGMKGGFFNSAPKKSTGGSTQSAKPVSSQPKPAEDLTHIKAKGKEEQLKFSEVQEAMQS
jgi:hypothetical protein